MIDIATTSDRTLGSQEHDQNAGVAKHELRSGDRIGRYHILDTLGFGGMGAVYRAFDPELERIVAIKIIYLRGAKILDPPHRDRLRTRLIREARGLAQLNHPNIVGVYDVGLVDDEDPFLTLEFLRGSNLREHLQTHALSIREIIDIYLQVASGLAAAHAIGIVHRDVKPDNCVLADDGRVRVLDFGLITQRTVASAAQFAGQSQEGSQLSNSGSGSYTRFLKLGAWLSGRRSRATLAQEFSMEDSPSQLSRAASRSSEPAATLDAITQVGTVLGTPRYMAPEQWRGDPASASSDVFSFCLSICEALTGVVAFASTHPRIVARGIDRTRVRWPRAVPKYLRELIECGLHLHAEKRPIDMRAWLLLYHEAQGRARRRVVAQRGTTFVAAAAALIQLSSSPEPPSHRCDLVGSDEIWRGEARTAIETQLTTSAPAYAGAILSRLDARLDAWEADYRALDAIRCRLAPDMSSSIPEHLPSGIQISAMTPDELPLLEQCLLHRRAALNAFVAGYSEKSTIEAWGNAPIIAAALPLPAECADPRAFRTEAPQPTDQEKILAVAEFRRELARIRIIANQSRQHEALDELNDLENDVRGVEFLPLLAEFVALRQALTASSVFALPLREVAQMNEEALILARRSGHVHIAARSATWLYFQRAYLLNERELGPELLQQAQSLVRAAGSPPTLEIDLIRMRAIEQGVLGNIESGAELFKSGLDLCRRTWPGGSPQETLFLEDLALFEILRGRWEDALHIAETGVALSHRLFGPAYPRLDLTYGRILDAQRELGRIDAMAEPLFHLFSACSHDRPEQEMQMRCVTAWEWLENRARLRGDFRDAIAVYTVRCELGLCRGAERTNPLALWPESELALTLLDRGEWQSALEQAQIGRELVEHEAQPPVETLALTYLIEARAQIAGGSLDAAATMLTKALTGVETSSFSQTALRSRFLRVQLEYFLAQKNPSAALYNCEQSVLLDEERNHAPQYRAETYRLCAEAFFQLGDIERAHEHAWIAWQQIRQVQGIRSQMYRPYREQLATVLLELRRPHEALEHIEASRAEFNAVEVLENRLAPFDFLEAKARYMLDDSENGRALVRLLAHRSLERFRDWDAGATPRISSVNGWLREIEGKHIGY